MDKRSGRIRTGLTATALAALGLLFVTLLVSDPQDNAYLGLWLLGDALMLSAVPYALATMLPDGPPRRTTLIAGLALSGVLGVIGTAILLISLLIITSQDYSYDPFVLRNHFIALGAFLAAHGSLFATYRPGFIGLFRRDA